MIARSHYDDATLLGLLSSSPIDDQSESILFQENV